jgi:transposase
MEPVIRQSIGIDIAKDCFTACICWHFATGKNVLSEVETFDNTPRGFNQLVKWVRKVCQPLPQAVFVMEATGIYYEPLAYHLYKLKQLACVILPNKVKYYSQSLNVKSKTDAIDAIVIAQMGAERVLPTWQPPAPLFKQLRALTRLYSDLKSQRTVFVNELKSAQAGNEPLAFVLKYFRTIIGKLDKEITKCEVAIQELVYQEQWFGQKVDKLLTIKGVGLITIAIILAETQGFKLIGNAKQLASYAGYDVVQHESGTSIRGRTKISKKGNSRIRAALYFPALVASRRNEEFSAVYQRINKGKSSKMIGVTALQRKILTLIYAMWKNDTVYNEFRQQDTSSGNHETKSLLRHKGEALDKKTSRPYSLPAQDELPSNQSTEVLLRQVQSS